MVQCTVRPLLDKHQIRGSLSPVDSVHESRKDFYMTTNTSGSHDADPNEPVPMMQQFLDNPFLLLFLGVMIPMVVYTVWGVFDILTVPLAK